MSKKLFALFCLCVSVISFIGCSNNDAPEMLTKLTIQLQYPENTIEPYEGAPILLKDAHGSTFEQKTNSKGMAIFEIPDGIYDVSTSDQKVINNTTYILNGNKSQVVVGKGGANIINITISATTKGTSTISSDVKHLIIKEIYNGGTPLNEGPKYFQNDQGFIIYNNSDQAVVAKNLCVGILDPYNANAPSNSWNKNGTLSYEKEGYIPASDGIWYFQGDITIKPFEQIVVSCEGAIDNTKEVTMSVNYAKEGYYAMYDPESGYNNPKKYPTPSEKIKSDHYLKVARWGMANAWPLSVSSPALFIFQYQGDKDIKAYAQNEANSGYAPGKKVDPSSKIVKIPTKWVIDGVEIYDASKIGQSHKRFTSNIDNGYVALTNKLGHTVYRNVDKAKTEALVGNKEKLVYNYNFGVEKSTDPSGIDAEASIKKGAKIIYMDTNNSTQDFHERQQFSIRN